MKRRNWILLAVLVLAMFLLSGCGVPHEGVDVVNTQPDGPWQQFVVWPLANILIGISNFLAGIGVTYYWGWAIIVLTVYRQADHLPADTAADAVCRHRKTCSRDSRNCKRNTAKTA